MGLLAPDPPKRRGLLGPDPPAIRARPRNLFQVALDKLPEPMAQAIERGHRAVFRPVPGANPITKVAGLLGLNEPLGMIEGPAAAAAAPLRGAARRTVAREASGAAGEVAQQQGRQRAIISESLRSLTTPEAMDAARSERHLIQGQEGQYVGAPRGVKTRQDVERLRANFDSQVEDGAIGADWYPRAQAGYAEITGNNPARNDLAAHEGALWSAQSNPETNLGFQLRAHNAFERGQPEPIVRTGAQASNYTESRRAGRLPRLGPKTGIYGGHINPNRAGTPPTTGTNDIWHARGFGFTNADGTTFSRGLTAQEHAWLDAETLLAMDRANARRLGGRDNWTVGEVQAAPWVSGKGRQLAAQHFKKSTDDLTPEELHWGLTEAAKTYPDYFDKHTAFGTHESIPGAGTGHLSGLLDSDFATRQQYANDPRSSWTDDTGRDVLYNAAGMYARSSNPATGYFVPKGGLLEVNPAQVARPLVDLVDDAGGKTVAPGTQKVLTAVEGVRALIDGQNMGAWHMPFGVGSAKAGAANSLFAPHRGPLSEAQVRGLAAVASKHGFDGLSDAGQGVTLFNFGGGPSSRDLPKMLRGELGTELNGLGLSSSGRARVVSDNVDYQDALSAANAGQGQATRQMFELLDDPDIPGTLAQLDASPELRNRALARYDRDAELEARTGWANREDLQRLRKIIADEGLTGLRNALKSGVALPAFALPYLASQVQQD